MEQAEHEKLLIQMIKEIRAMGVVVSGQYRHFLFLRETKMIKATKLFGGNNGGQSKMRYKLTPKGEGLLAHLLTKHEGTLNGKCDEEICCDSRNDQGASGGDGNPKTPQ